MGMSDITPAKVVRAQPGRIKVTTPDGRVLVFSTTQWLSIVAAVLDENEEGPHDLPADG
jgi:hypothetical protein